MKSLSVRLVDHPVFTQWKNYGYPVVEEASNHNQIFYGSLLSMYNKEMSMILDTFAAVYALRAVQFRIQYKRVSVVWRCEL